MIIDEKFILAAPPPPYVSPQTSIVLGSNNPYNPYRQHYNVSLPALPSHLLLQVVYSTFPQAVGTSDGESFASQRENLFWLETSLRLVNRALYIACMHILRSTYLSTYDRLVKAPYTSDPFPSSGLESEASSPSIILKHHRELSTLDRFIALLAHEERLLDATELHLPCEEAYRDMFDFIQPKSRLEDLVAQQGQLRGIIYVDCSRQRLAPSSPAPSTMTLRANDSSTSLKKLADDEKQSCSSSCSIRSYSAPPALSKKKSFFPFRRSKKPVPIYTPPPPPPQPVALEPIPFSTLSIAFSPRKVGLVYAPPAPPPAIPATTTSSPSRSSSSSSSAYGGSTYGSLSMSMNAHLQRKKTLVEITRTRDETLESCAKRLVQALLIRMEE